MSGHGEPVTATAAAASRTATLPITSLREHTQAERMLMSSPRRLRRRPRQTRLAPSARSPTVPMTSTAGASPYAILKPAWTSTPAANPPISMPFRRAARACHPGPRDTAYRLNP